MKRVKHYHVKYNDKLAIRHLDIKCRIQALGMVFRSQVLPAISDVSKASDMLIFNGGKKDFTEADLVNYIHLLNNAIVTVHELVPSSDLCDVIERLKVDSVSHITGDPHDPHLDVPSDSALVKAGLILFPNGVTDTRVPSSQMQKDVLFRIAKYLDTVPKQYGGCI